MRTKHLILLSTAALLWGCGDSKPAETKTTAAPVKYKLTSVLKEDIAQTVKLPAQLAAYQEISVFPKVNGYVKSVLVDIGSHVNKGQQLLILEAPEIQQAAIQAQEKYAHAKSQFTLSKENYARLVVASKTAGAIAPMDLAAARSKAEADSATANSEKASWQMQQTMLAYLKVSAPFSGIITERNTNPGALVSAEAKDKPMLQLKEVDHLRLQVDIPEAFSASLKANDKVSFYLTAMPGKKMTASISRKSGNVNIQYRAERVELDVPNPDGSLSPGMYADVILQSKGNPNALIVPKSAVVTSTERKYVVAVRNGKTVKIDVATGVENNNKIEVIGDLNTNDKVIASATDEIDEGISVN